jgi:PilZ domain-containing protein
VIVTHLPINEPSESKLEFLCKLRENKRRPVAIPLKVNFLSSGRIAHVCTLDVSPTGARLHSAGHHFHPGDVILLQRRIERAHARVVWVGEESCQVGIECLEVDKVFWKEEKLAAANCRHITFRFRR